MRGLYVHVPFCVKKCDYCDFYSIPIQKKLIGPYIKALLDECRKYAGLSFDTLYLGGGTPSLLGAENLIKLIEGLRTSFDFSKLVESTIEVNPESATADFLEAARSVGITRISIGVQSLSQRELKSVSRIHIAEQAVDAINRALKLCFKSVSADLIVGLPGQTWQTLQESLSGVISLRINHLSLYCLSLEHDTPLAIDPPVDLPSDDIQADLFERAMTFLKSRNFCHYEISNFAVKGFECLHNLNYWRGGEYLGLGPAAASHLDGRRFKNQADLYAYLQNPGTLIPEDEFLKPEDKAAEEAMLRLRLLSEGLDPEDLVKCFGQENVLGLIARLEEIAKSGDLVYDGSTYRLAPSKILTSNRIFTRVLFG